MGVILAVVFILVGYTPLRHSSATSFRQISAFRTQLLGNSLLGQDLNVNAYLLAAATAVSTAFALAARERRLQVRYWCAAALCAFGTFLTLSRGAVAIAVVSMVICVLTIPRHRPRNLAILSIIGLFVIAVIPRAGLARFTLNGSASSTSRLGLYVTAYHDLHSYLLTGVGSGNFWNAWGANNGFADPVGQVFGSHDSFVQIAIYWGAGVLALFVWFLWRLSRRMPKYNLDPMLALALRAIAVATVMYLFFTFDFYQDEFAAPLGLILAGRVWMASGAPLTSGLDVRPSLTTLSISTRSAGTGDPSET
jgi:hypothetical protein